MSEQSTRNRASRRNATPAGPEPVAVLTADTTFKPWDDNDGKNHECAKYTENVLAAKPGSNNLFAPVVAGTGRPVHVLSGKALYPMNDALRQEFLARGVTEMPRTARVTIEFFA